MAVVMRLMMGKVFLNNKLNTGIVLTSIVVLRTAIMVNKHSNIEDREAKKLSEQIIQSQKREIAEMEAMLSRME